MLIRFRALLALFLTAWLSQAALAASPPPKFVPATLAERSYNDPAMHYIAPAGVVLLMKHHVPYQSATQMTPVAIWGFDPGKRKARVITISFQAASGSSLDDFYSAFIGAMRAANSGDLFSAKRTAQLSNGMPAYWVNIRHGSGFSEYRIYGYVWYDGARGVALIEQGRFGEIGEEQARMDLAGASAVAYPVGRDY